MKNHHIIKGKTVYIYFQNGKVAQIDLDDLKKVQALSWYAHKDYATYYVHASVGKNKKILLHRYLMKPPNDKQIDHINGDGLDNRRENLQIVTNQQNSFNSRKHKSASSQYKGVYWDSSRLKWKVQIGFNGKRIAIGRFDTEEEAALAYNEKAIELYGADFANLNGVPIKTMAA